MVLMLDWWRYDNIRYNVFVFFLYDVETCEECIYVTWAFRHSVKHLNF